MNITPESVKELLASPDFSDRLRGINQLRELEPAVAFPLLEPVINDGNARVRYAAISQMDTLGGQDLQATATILRDRLLNDPEPDVQAAAADAIGALQLTEAFEDLQQVYQSTSEWLVQFSIIAMLGEFGDPRGFEMLQEAIASDNELLKTTAIASFGELGDDRAVPLLIPFATNPDWQIRHRVAQALQRLGGSEASSTLEVLAKDPVEQVAQAAKLSE
ncbi:MAG: HEAT repeat domain-containing protein [Cyanosarcina radialis HA8281-LM2]|jgi:HEAT repeat protein|nr:HEAT repeat domain-containing protein [Cyanosarcina radialis HA8281-LM2]